MSKFSKVSAFIGAKVTFLYVAASVYAASTGPGGQLIQPPAGSVDLPADDVKNVPQLIINLLFGTAIFLTVAYLMYGGIKWITSRGDKVGVEAARKHIVAAVIGLIVVAGTFFMLNVVFNLLGVADADNPLKKGFTLPTVTNPGR